MPPPDILLPCDSVLRPAGFDFTGHMRWLCEDIVSRLPELRHIDIQRVAVGFCQTRRKGPDGAQAAIIPLRFRGGQVETVRGGRRYRLQRVCDPSGREMLYIVNFYLPRFLNLPLEEKLTTVMHELWHIGPQCDGDLRRHGGRCHVHSARKQAFDAHARQLARRWLALGPPEPLWDFLRYDFSTLEARYGRVVGTRVPRPKLIPL